MKALSIVVVSLSLVLVGCAGSSSYMRDVPEGEKTYAPEAGKALLVIMRPSGIGFAVQSSVFDVTSGEPGFIAIVSAKTKFAHHVDPGQHRFMVIGESADFMDATFAEGKTYYALVTPRVGVWKARFSLRPVHKVELDTDESQGWYDECRWVEGTPQAKQWAEQNLTDIKSKQASNLPKWLNKPDKPVLFVEDGK